MQYAKAQAERAMQSGAWPYQSVLVRFGSNARLMPDSNISASSRRRLLSPFFTPPPSPFPHLEFESPFLFSPHLGIMAPTGSKALARLSLCTEYRLGNAHSLFRAILPPCLIHRDGHDP